MHIKIALMLFVLSFGFGVRGQAEDEPDAIGVCDVFSRLTELSGKTVAVRGTLSYRDLSVRPFATDDTMSGDAGINGHETSLA